jgi:hypothetical protein
LNVWSEFGWKLHLSPFAVTLNGFEGFIEFEFIGVKKPQNICFIPPIKKLSVFLLKSFKKSTKRSFCICFLSKNVGIPSKYQVPKHQIAPGLHKFVDKLFFPLQF